MLLIHKQKAREDNKKAKELEEKNQKKEAEREKRVRVQFFQIMINIILILYKQTQRLQTEAQKQKTAQQPGGQNVETVVDDLLTTVRDGDAFRNRYFTAHHILFANFFFFEDENVLLYNSYCILIQFVCYQTNKFNLSIEIRLVCAALSKRALSVLAFSLAPETNSISLREIVRN